MADEEYSIYHAGDERAAHELVESLAPRFGITDVNRLNAAISQILSTLRDTAGGSAAFMRTDEDDGSWEISSTANIERVKRADKLISKLVLEIIDAAPPVGRTRQARDLLRTLGKYQSNLRKLEFITSSKELPKKWEQWNVVIGVAIQWKKMTGEKPTAYPNSYKEPKGGGRFFEFICALCGELGLETPSARSVHRWLGSVRCQIDRLEG